jgi:hypothetical protein
MVPDEDTPGWAAGLRRLLVGTAIGASLGTAYGVLVGGVHLLTAGRLDRGPAFALWAVAAGAALGLAASFLVALAGRRTTASNSSPSLDAFSSPKPSRLPDLPRQAPGLADCLNGPGWHFTASLPPKAEPPRPAAPSREQQQPPPRSSY